MRVGKLGLTARKGAPIPLWQSKPPAMAATLWPCENDQRNSDGDLGITEPTQARRTEQTKDTVSTPSREANSGTRMQLVQQKLLPTSPSPQASAHIGRAHR
eukprot:5357481-Alexandrium_andersonii.AAC.1